MSHGRHTFTSSNELDPQDGSSASSPTSTPLTIVSQGTPNVTGIPGLSGVVLNAQGATNQSSAASHRPPSRARRTQSISDGGK